ncbi:MAG TPA: FliG C-terminal domain-containing protein [Sandaracinaceae bacterium LLY-WYZ-13_1]|nr:FliG C-terminal domain-containing protein [Sandaracinaceae bacterium LLY-WYZ-13_1]
MSRKNLESLLDSMLDESAETLEAERAREAEARRAAQRAKRAESLRERTAERPAGTFEAVDRLTGLPEPDLRQVLAKAAPDDLLVVLATAGDTLQRRILTNLGEESVRWLRENLQHMDDVRDAEREASEAKVLKVANELLAEGTIGLPEEESMDAAEAPRAEEKALRDLLTDLVRIAEQAGSDALSEVAESAGEPLLREGLARVAEGRRGEALRAELADVRARLERRYAERLKLMVEAVVAIGDGETADSFRERIFEETT